MGTPMVTVLTGPLKSARELAPTKVIDAAAVVELKAAAIQARIATMKAFEITIRPLRQAAIDY